LTLAGFLGQSDGLAWAQGYKSILEHSSEWIKEKDEIEAAMCMKAKGIGVWEYMQVNCRYSEVIEAIGVSWECV
jgi:hypothetical protein